MRVSLEPCPVNPAIVYRDSLSPGSYSAVRHSLETVAEILAGGAADPWTFPWEEVRYQHVARVRRELIERFAPATVNKMLSALRQVFKHAWRLGHLDHETYARVTDVENVKVCSRKRGRAVELRELEALFAVCADDPSPTGRRDAAMLAVLYGGGLRRSELCALDLADFDPASGGLTVRNGKARRDRTIHLNPATCRYLVAWTPARGAEPGPLFCPVNSAGSVRRTRLCGESVWYVVGRRQREAGLEGVSPHGLRRSFVTGLLEAGVDLFTVQRLAGHVQAATTARYDRRGERAERLATKALPVPPAA